MTQQQVERQLGLVALQAQFAYRGYGGLQFGFGLVDRQLVHHTHNLHRLDGLQRLALQLHALLRDAQLLVEHHEGVVGVGDGGDELQPRVAELLLRVHPLVFSRLFLRLHPSAEVQFPAHGERKLVAVGGGAVLRLGGGGRRRQRERRQVAQFGHPHLLCDLLHIEPHSAHIGVAVERLGNQRPQGFIHEDLLPRARRQAVHQRDVLFEEGRGDRLFDHRFLYGASDHQCRTQYQKQSIFHDVQCFLESFETQQTVPARRRGGRGCRIAFRPPRRHRWCGYRWRPRPRRTSGAAYR